MYIIKYNNIIYGTKLFGIYIYISMIKYEVLNGYL